MGKFVDYYEHVLTHTYWYGREFSRIVGQIISITMPVILGKFVSEAYKAITAAPNLKSWSTWSPHWPVLVVLGTWLIGYFINRYVTHTNLKSTELYNSLTWFCKDIDTRENKKKDIRCTIWIPMGKQSRVKPVRLLQAIPYFPKTSTMFDDYDKRIGNVRKNGNSLRTFKVSRRKNNEYQPIGILGQTAINSMSGEDPTIGLERINKNTNFADHMITHWNFTKFQADRLTSDRKSYLCLPMVDNKKKELLGILYFDSRKPRTFNDQFIVEAEYYLPRLAEIITTL